MIVILMGVTGTGKTTIGTLLAKRTGWHYAEGDDYHSEANKAKMHAGIPLTDEDRAPWLATLHEVLLGWYRRWRKRRPDLLRAETDLSRHAGCGNGTHCVSICLAEPIA